MTYSKETKQQLSAAKRKDIETILRQEKLNLYQLEMCMEIDQGITEKLLIGNPDIVKKVEKLFEDPKTYFVQKRLKEMGDRGHLSEVFDVDNQLLKTEETIKKLSGEEVFNIFTKQENTIEDYNKTQTLKSVLASYYKDTPVLSEYHREGDKDLFYTKFGEGEKKAPRWTQGLNRYLDEIGIFQDNPELESLMEEKIGALFSYATFDKSRTKFVYVNNAGTQAFRYHMKEELQKDPHSSKSKFFITYAGDVLSFEDKDSLQYHKEPTFREIMENWLQKQPEVGLLFLEREKKYCSLDYLVKLYNMTQNEALLPMLAEKMRSSLDKDGKLSAKEKVFAYQYVQKTNNDEFKQIAAMPIQDSITVNKDFLTLYGESQSFKDSLKGTTIKKIKVDMAGLTKKQLTEEYKEALQDFISNQSYLEEINLYNPNNNQEYALDASILCAAKRLKRLDIYTVAIDNPQKMRTQLTQLEKFSAHYDNHSMSAVYCDVLLETRPSETDVIKFPAFTYAQEERLMHKYPDLLVNPAEGFGSSESDLKRRNRTIIKAKKSRKIDDVIPVIHQKGFIEYLQSVSKKDRPTFEDLNKKVYDSYVYHDKSCLELMREIYKGTYIETLSQVADLCDLADLKKETELLKAIQEKRVVEHFKSLKPEERPTLLSLCKDKTIATEDGKPIIESIKKAYQKEYAGTMAEVLTMFGASKQDLALLQEDKDLASIAKQYAERQQYEQTAAVSKSAFEKWKEKQQKGL